MLLSASFSPMRVERLKKQKHGCVNRKSKEDCFAHSPLGNLPVSGISTKWASFFLRHARYPRGNEHINAPVFILRKKKYQKMKRIGSQENFKTRVEPHNLL